MARGLRVGHPCTRPWLFAIFLQTSLFHVQQVQHDRGLRGPAWRRHRDRRGERGPNRIHRKRNLRLESHQRFSVVRRSNEEQKTLRILRQTHHQMVSSMQWWVQVKHGGFVPLQSGSGDRLRVTNTLCSKLCEKWKFEMTRTWPKFSICRCFVHECQIFFVNFMKIGFKVSTILLQIAIDDGYNANFEKMEILKCTWHKCHYPIPGRLVIVMNISIGIHHV